MALTTEKVQNKISDMIRRTIMETSDIDSANASMFVAVSVIPASEEEKKHAATLLVDLLDYVASLDKNCEIIGTKEERINSLTEKFAETAQHWNVLQEHINQATEALFAEAEKEEEFPETIE